MSDVHERARIGYVVGATAGNVVFRIDTEIAALSAEGWEPRVFVRETNATRGAANDVASEARVCYGPLRRSRARSAILRHVGSHPWTVLAMWRFVARQRYELPKSLWLDRDLLYEATELADALRDERVAHVHAPAIGRPAAVAYVAAHLAGLTFSLDASDPAIHRRLERHGVAELARSASVVIAGSRFDARYLKQLRGGAASPRIDVVYDGGSSTAAARHEAGESGDARLLAVGPLAEHSGLRDLLAACARLQERGVVFVCDIVGGALEPRDTAAWVELRRLHRRLGLDNTVCFYGAQTTEAVARAIGRADVFVSASTAARDGTLDPLPPPLLDAMARGLAVVATRVGAIEEVVADDVDGLLVPPGEPAALAAALERLVHDAALRRRLGEAARHTVETRFKVARSTVLSGIFRRLTS